MRLFSLLILFATTAFISTGCGSKDEPSASTVTDAPPPVTLMVKAKDGQIEIINATDVQMVQFYFLPPAGSSEHPITKLIEGSKVSEILKALNLNNPIPADEAMKTAERSGDLEIHFKSHPYRAPLRFNIIGDNLIVEQDLKETAYEVGVGLSVRSVRNF